MKINIASRKLESLLVVLLAALAPLPTVAAQPQNERRLAVKEINQLPAKAKRFALIVGVDEYQDTQISRLSGATNDAKSLADALVRYAGFPQDQVILLASDQPLERQPTRGNLLRRLSNLKGTVPEDGLLLVSFAGHGIERGGRGFLCTSDAQINGDLALLEDTAISVEMVRERIRQMGVKQVLIILDACRNDPSGRGEQQNKLTDSFAQKFNFDVRNQEVAAFATLYATDVGHVAYEYKEKHQGYFTWALVEGLQGGAANERGEVTLGGLVTYLQEQVPKRIRLDLGQEKLQKPLVRVEGYKANDLVLSVMARVNLDKPAPSTVDAAAIEIEFWKSIKSSIDLEDFRAYLKKYPDGQFADLARNRIKALEPSESPRKDAPSDKPASETRPASNPSVPVQPQKSSYEAERLLKVVKLNALPVQEVVDAIKQRGVNFQMIPAIEAEFRNAGARTELIEAMRMNYRPPFKYENRPENLKALLETIHDSIYIKKDSKLALSLFVSLIPNEERAKIALRNEAPHETLQKILNLYKQAGAVTDTEVNKLAKPEQRLVIVHGATTEEIATGSVASSKFPGGAKMVAEGLLRSGMTFYEAEFLEPGKEYGMTYHLFYWDGSQWTMLGPVWRALR